MPQSNKAALDAADDGAQRATGAGLVAQLRIANRDDNIAAVILAVAADVHADVIVHLVPGGDGKVTETASLGEASRSCGSGSGDGITSGSVSWTTVTVPAGRYEMICNLANHYTDGMYEQLTVT